jgi:signal transduction histidine kinase
MATDAMSLPGGARLVWRARLRGLFAGSGYAALVGLAQALWWSLQGVAGDVPHDNAIAALRQFGSLLLIYCLIILPALPAIVVAANRAPRAGLLRYLCLAAAGSALLLSCAAVGPLFFDGTAVLSDYVESFIEATLTVVACAYRNSARTATSALMQNQIEGATVDAELKRARLQLLRAQIEPHFLFNTLATVRTLARIDRAAAVEMIDNLMRYLSEALPKLRRDESSLAEELQLIDAYLRIHQIRMGTRLAYELSVPSELGTARIPTMVLLTLVENAVKHGINPAVEGGFIHVSAARERSSLVLRVADSGRGMTELQGHGTGLANVRLRLTMLYGNDAVLSLARAESRGVVATVSIPLVRTA